MLIGGDKHEMAAFTPDQERAVMFWARWASSALSRKLLSTARGEEKGRPQLSILCVALEVEKTEKSVQFTYHPTVTSVSLIGSTYQEVASGLLCQLGL